MVVSGECFTIEFIKKVHTHFTFTTANLCYVRKSSQLTLRSLYLNYSRQKFKDNRIDPPSVKQMQLIPQVSQCYKHFSFLRVKFSSPQFPIVIFRDC